MGEVVHSDATGVHPDATGRAGELRALTRGETSFGSAYRRRAWDLGQLAAHAVLIGSAAGLLCAYFLMKPLAMFLVSGLRPSDPVTYIVIAGILASTAAVAAWRPARRAAAVDPVTALRAE